MPQRPSAVHAAQIVAGFVADGQQRAVAAVEPEIREEVARRYAERLEDANWLERREIRRQMEAEITARVNAAAPPEALY